MRMSGIRKGVYVAAAVGALAGSLLGISQTAHAAGPPVFDLTPVGAYGGEPSLTSDSNGVLYATTPSGPQTYRSTNKGASWTNIQSPDNNSGDDCLNTDSQNSLYWCNLGSTTKGNLPLQADVWKSTAGDITTCTTSCNWQYGNNATTAGTCGTSCNPFGVDRQWVASTISGKAPSTDTAHAIVVLMYHDFYGPSHIWVNVSKDGGKTFGTAQEVLSGGFTNNPTGTVTAEGYTFCNTVPTGVGIAPPGSPHHGRIFVSWIAADPVSDTAGCNITQAEAFHTAWVAYSDDQGTTWTPQMAFDAGIGHDMSTPFAAFTLDNQGNPYIGFDSPAPSQNPATCAAESGLGTVQSDKSCSNNMYVVWSHDGGNTWDGGSPANTNPLLTGAAATAYRANPTAENGTDVFPTIAAGDPGKVDVSYLHTSEIDPTDAAGKFLPLGCAGPTNSNPNYPPRCLWNLETSQSLNLNNTPATATFTKVQATTSPMHFGDICNLGIACAPTTPDPRHLLDFNQETVDPTTGCAHIVYADDNAGATYGDPTAPSPFGNHLVSANQVDGPAIVGTGVCGAAVITPEVPLSLLLPLAGAGVLVAVGVRRHRRGSSPLSM
jgi:hypothetical protein